MPRDRLNAGLSIDQAPPISVPIRFFITSPFFGVLTALLYLMSGTDAMVSRWTAESLAATHLLALGYISMAMMGAMMQMLPVLVGVPVPRPRLQSVFVHGLVTIGVLNLAGGFLLGNSVLLQLALGSLGTGFLLFIGVTLYCLSRARASNATVKGLWLAIVSLLVTVILGITLAEARSGQMEAFHSVGWTNLHIAWGLMGWIGILLISVAYEVVPMFQITSQYSTWMKKWLTKTIVIVLIVWLSINLLPGVEHPIVSLLKQLLSIILICSLALFAAYTLFLHYRRRRRITDYTLRFWRLGMWSVIVGGVVWIIGIIWDWPMQWGNMDFCLGIVFLVGVVISVINGMLYKIIPFLIWLHLQGKISTPSRPPNMKSIIPDSAVCWHYRLHFISLIVLIFTLLFAPWLIYPAAILFAAACMLLFKNICSALWIYRQVMTG